MRFLIAKGADIHAHGRFGTPLRAASLGGNISIVRRLLASGASLNEKSILGDALQAAALKGHTAIVGLLLAKGADINAHGRYHGNALQAASFNGHEDVVRLLLEKGADVSAPGRFDDAVQAAFETGQDHLLHLLLDKMELFQNISTPDPHTNEDTDSFNGILEYGSGGGGGSWGTYCRSRSGYFLGRSTSYSYSTRSERSRVSYTISASNSYHKKPTRNRDSMYYRYPA